MIVRDSLKFLKICIGKNIFHPGNLSSMKHFDTHPLNYTFQGFPPDPPVFPENATIDWTGDGRGADISKKLTLDQFFWLKLEV